MKPFHSNIWSIYIDISLVKKQFDFVKNISQSAARQPKTMTVTKSLGLVTQYNPILTDLNKTIAKYLPMLYSDPNMKLAFPKGAIKATYRRGKNLKEMVSPSLFPIKTGQTPTVVYRNVINVVIYAAIT